MNWQPIATAPKDGTHILACNAASSFGWIDGKALPPVQTVVHWWGHGTPGFYTSVNELEPQRPFDATHWKPLDAPAAPDTRKPWERSDWTCARARVDSDGMHCPEDKCADCPNRTRGVTVAGDQTFSQPAADRS